jgi:hypothetical protein
MFTIRPVLIARNLSKHFISKRQNALFALTREKDILVATLLKNVLIVLCNYE